LFDFDYALMKFSFVSDSDIQMDLEFLPDDHSAYSVVVQLPPTYKALLSGVALAAMQVSKGS